jgi:hypothetical protein
VRLVACPEPDGSWSFHLINDSDAPIPSVVLESVEWEWGDWGDRKTIESSSGPVPPRASREVWRGDDGEMRMEIRLRVAHPGGTGTLKFSFGKIYLRRDSLERIPGFGRPGVTGDPGP